MSWGPADPGAWTGTAACPECKRVFDLFNTADAAEWAHGHDCEAVE